MRQKLFIVRMKNLANLIILLKVNGVLFMTKQWKLSSTMARDLLQISDITQNPIWQKILKTIFNCYSQIFILEIMVALIQIANKQWLVLYKHREEVVLQCLIIELHASTVNKMYNMILKILSKNLEKIWNSLKYNDILKT